MSHRTEKHPVSVVTACMKPDGTPTFALHTVGVTTEEIANGLHYDLVEMQLLKGGYEEPFVHFAEHEAPAFLHAGVRRLLGVTPRIHDAVLSASEGR